jgi:hypothetical protein
MTLILSILLLMILAMAALLIQETALAQMMTMTVVAVVRHLILVRGLPKHLQSYQAASGVYVGTPTQSLKR